ncbi:7966_t:CDS:2 [Entrophospora sp. SA101]|nr:7966_t:CDS:2 [Entrophospora sp. SA101]
MSNFDRGNSFELEILKIAKKIMICFRPKIELSSGDNGIDIWGIYGNYLILIQCTSVVASLESILSACPPNTLSVAVIPFKTNYTKDAFRMAAISKYNIILTKDNEFYLDMKKAIDNLNNNNTLTNEKDAGGNGLKRDKIERKAKKLKKIDLFEY